MPPRSPQAAPPLTANELPRAGAGLSTALPRPSPAGAVADRSLAGLRVTRGGGGGGARQIQAAAGGGRLAARPLPGAGMEALTFPRYSPDDIISYLRSHVLAGAEARNLVKGDVFGNPKVREGVRGRPRPALAGREW